MTLSGIPKRAGAIRGAIRHLGDALSHWKQYAAIRDAHYVPALYNRIGYVDVTRLTEKVAADEMENHADRRHITLMLSTVGPEFPELGNDRFFYVLGTLLNKSQNAFGIAEVFKKWFAGDLPISLNTSKKRFSPAEFGRAETEWALLDSNQ